jgi:hypothetical protein
MSFTRMLPGLIGLLAGSPFAGAADLTFVGRAHDLETGALLYTETHAVRDSGGPQEARVVSYRCAGGALFARKTLDFGATRIAPAFALDDARSGTSEGLERGARGFSVFARSRGATPRSKALSDVSGMVVDAGFDEFVRARWETLDGGAPLVVPFLVPSRLDTVKFRVRKTGETTIDGRAASVFRLSVASPFGWFLPDIDVSYRKEDRRLLRYRGLTNLRDAEGGMISARIDFHDADRDTAAVDLAALRARPLSRSCGG